MKLLISFSARKNGNSDEIAKYLANDEDHIIYFRDLNIHNCSNCEYECFYGYCKFHHDEIYSLYERMSNYQKIILIVPMYCGNPSSLYFIFNERCQDYFMHHEDKYEDIIKKLFIIGIYGDREKTPDFLSCFEKWFVGTKYENHVLGIERHRYNLKLRDSILKVEEVKNQIDEFINPKNAIAEKSAMAVVLFENKILTINEIIYGRKVISLPKGHQENNESLIMTAIRECYEETNIEIDETNLVKELPTYSYEFLTPANQLIRKIIVPYLFIINNYQEPLPKEQRIIFVKWMDINEFLNICSYDNVKNIVKESIKDNY